MTLNKTLKQIVDVSSSGSSKTWCKEYICLYFLLSLTFRMDTLRFIPKIKTLVFRVRRALRLPISAIAATTIRLLLPFRWSSNGHRRKNVHSRAFAPRKNKTKLMCCVLLISPLIAAFYFSTRPARTKIAI